MDVRHAVPRGRERNSRGRKRRMRVTEELSEDHNPGAEALETRPGRNENLSEATGTAGRLRWGKAGPNGEGDRGHADLFSFPLDASRNHGCGVPAEDLEGSIRRCSFGDVTPSPWPPFPLKPD
jgi:hypothetical protein